MYDFTPPHPRRVRNQIDRDTDGLAFPRCQLLRSTHSLRQRRTSNGAQSHPRNLGPIGFSENPHRE
jgi:hypothetical protein